MELENAAGVALELENIRGTALEPENIAEEAMELENVSGLGARTGDHLGAGTGERGRMLTKPTWRVIGAAHEWERYRRSEALWTFQERNRSSPWAMFVAQGFPSGGTGFLKPTRSNASKGESISGEAFLATSLASHSSSVSFSPDAESFPPCRSIMI